MDEQLEHQAEAILQQLLDIPRDARRALIRKACGNNAPLRTRVDSLATALDEMQGFLMEPTVNTDASDNSGEHETIFENAGSCIGPYTLVEEIGEGGFGVVFRAEQTTPVHRMVALKIIKPGMDSRAVIRRFAAERQSLAMMDHPSIARVFDAGMTPQGRPYFAMELVTGVAITEYCDQQRLTVHQRLELIVQVCRAVQSAHGRGVIHRDLKPGNVLVTQYDGKPVTKLIDFGIAMATSVGSGDPTLASALGGYLGTPRYMSPEQFELSPMEIDTRSDVYGLGILAYQLLTGRTPLEPEQFERAPYEAISRLVRENEPPEPSAKVRALGDGLDKVAANRGTDGKGLRRQLQGDLDWVLGKALEKDRTLRYDTAAALADDFARHLRGEAVSVGPQTGWRQLKRIARRHKATLFVSSLVTLAMVAGLIGTSYGLVREARQRRIAESERAIADQQRGAALAGQTEAEHQRTRANRQSQAAIATVNFICADVLNRANAGSGLNKQDRDTLVRLIIKPAVETIDARFANMPLPKAAVQQTLASILGSLGRPDLALIQAQAALAARRIGYGENDVDTLMSLQSVAQNLTALGKYGQAEPMYRHLVDVLHSAHSEELNRNEVLCDSIEQYAALLVDQGDYDHAAPLLTEAVDRKRRLFGEENYSTIRIMIQQTSADVTSGHFARAEPQARIELERARTIAGAANILTLDAGQTLAMALCGLGRGAEAEPIAMADVQEYRRQLGDENPSTLHGQERLAVIYFSEGKITEAEPLFKQIMETSRRVNGDENPLTNEIAQNYAYMLRSLGRNAEANALPENRPPKPLVSDRGETVKGGTSRP